MDWKDVLKGLTPDNESLPSQDDASPAGDAQEIKAAPKNTMSLLKGCKVHYERKRRGGKEATILAGFTCSDDELKELARMLKQRLGTGGSARGGEILLQGDCRTKLKELTNQH